MGWRDEVAVGRLEVTSFSPFVSWLMIWVADDFKELATYSLPNTLIYFDRFVW